MLQPWHCLYLVAMISSTYQTQFERYNISNKSATNMSPDCGQIMADGQNMSDGQNVYSLDEGFAHIAAGLFLTIIIVSASCNVLLITTIISVRRLHSYMHVLVVNMAVSDLITSLGTIPFDVEFMLRHYFAHGNLICGIMNITFLISLPSSVLCLALLTAERFVSVVYPYRVHNIVKKSTVMVSIIFMWIYVLFVGLFPIMYNKDAFFVRNRYCYLVFPLGYQLFQMIANFLIPSVLIFGTYIVLFYISNKHANKHPRSSRPRRQARKNKSGEPWKGSNSNRRKSSEQLHIVYKKQNIRSMAALSRNMRAVKRIVLLVGVFIVCWLCYILIVATNYVCTCLSREVTWVANIINHSSTAINPVLYGLMNKSIRREIFRKLMRIFKPCFPNLIERNMFNASFELRCQKTFISESR